MLKYPVILSLLCMLFSLHGFSQKRTYDPKVKINSKREAVIKQYGTPYNTIDTVDVYRDQGFIIKYNKKKKAQEIIFTWFVGGKHFSGLIYGIQLGDTAPKCERIWGKPLGEPVGFLGYYELTYRVKKCLLRVEFWEEAGSDESFGGNYEIDTVKRISISKQ